MNTTEPTPDDAVSTAAEEYIDILRTKILFSLKVYPFLSPSMLHVALGTATSTALWKPILEALIVEGKVNEAKVQLTSPHDRSQTYTILHLSDNTYVPAPKVNDWAH